MRKPRGNAFTLIELLVVIAIIALLLALLMPMLNKAKEITRRLLCATNQKSLGTAAYGFAGENQGRGPGNGLLGNVNNSSWFSSYSWANILNLMFYRESKVQRSGMTAKKNMLYCPSMAPYRSTSVRAYMWNRDATGGPTWGGNEPQGPYGAIGDIDLANARIKEDYPHYYFQYYYLGAKLERFTPAAEKVLLIENERAADVFGASSTTIAQMLYANRGGYSYPPWSNSSGLWAFRHLKGNDVEMYRSRATANYLFVDGHVETHTPQHNLADKAHVSLED